MDTIEKNSLLNYLSKMDFNYREKLNVPEDIPFGAEIEFMTNNKHEVEKNIRKVINTNSSSGKIYKLGDFRRCDKTTRENRIFEIKTPILTNKEADFESLKNVCNGLTQIGSTESNQKGVHVHVDLSSLDGNEKNLTTFLKLFCLYEHIIFRFSYGNLSESNININSYSREVSSKLYNYLSNNNNPSFSRMISDLRTLFKLKNYALNFHQKDFSCKNETIEIRSFNSTLKPVIIQNDINFSLNMINQIREDYIDLDFLDYKFSEYDREFYIKKPYSELNLDDAIEFTDLIFTNDTDKDYFLRQYAVKDSPKQKRLVI